MTNDWDMDSETEEPTNTINEVDGAILEEDQPVEQQIVPFMGDELSAAMTSTGTIYISFPGMCVALGLNIRGQTQRVQRTRALQRALRRIPLETRGGIQAINCLRIDLLALWLAGVQTKQIKLEYRAKIEAYQDELAPVATQIFMRVLGIKQTWPTHPSTANLAQVEFAEISEQLDTLNSVVTFLREHLDAGFAATGEQISALSLRLDDALHLLEALGEHQSAIDQRQDSAENQLERLDERTQHLTTAHARAIQEMVDQMVRKTKRLPIPLTHMMIYGRVKHRFRAGAFREIADDQYTVVMAFLQDELRKALAGENPEQSSLF